MAQKSVVVKMKHWIFYQKMIEPYFGSRNARKSKALKTRIIALLPIKIER